MDTQARNRMLTAYAAGPRIVRGMRARFGPAVDAEAHVAEAVFRSRAPSVETEHHVCTRAHKTACGLAIDERRHQASAARNAARLADPPQAPSTEDLYLESELGERATRELAALPPDQRMVVRAYADGHSLKEIATLSGRTLYAVKHSLHRGLATLRERLRDAELALVAGAARTRRRRSRRLSSRTSLHLGGGAASFLGAAPAYATALPLVVASVGGIVAGPSQPPTTPTPTTVTAATSQQSASVARPVRTIPALPTRSADLPSPKPRGELSRHLSHPAGISVRTGVSVRDRGKKAEAHAEAGVNDDGSHAERGDVRGLVSETRECLAAGPVISIERIGCPDPQN